MPPVELSCAVAPKIQGCTSDYGQVRKALQGVKMWTQTDLSVPDHVNSRLDISSMKTSTHDKMCFFGTSENHGMLPRLAEVRWYISALGGKIGQSSLLECSCSLPLRMGPYRPEAEAEGRATEGAKLLVIHGKRRNGAWKLEQVWPGFPFWEERGRSYIGGKLGFCYFPSLSMNSSFVSCYTNPLAQEHVLHNSMSCRETEHSPAL